MLLLHGKMTFEHEGKTESFDFLREPECGVVKTSFTREKGRLRVMVEASEKITVSKLAVTFSYPYSQDTKILLNGYESWTDTFEHDIKDTMYGLSRVPAPLRNQFYSSQYGDYNFADYPQKPGRMHGYTYGYLREDKEFTLIGSVSEYEGFTVIKTDVSRKTVTVEKECEGLCIEGSYKAFDLCIFRGSEDSVFDAYFAAMKTPRREAKPIFGYCSWYQHYQNISHTLISRNLRSMKNCEIKADVFQIDDGYQSHVGDWLMVNHKKFPSGMAAVSRMISRQEMLPGIWLAPFAAEFDSVLVKEHPDWILRDKNGEKVIGGCNWGGFYALDFENEAFRDYLKEVFTVVTKHWGFKLLKLDFLYAACLVPQNGKTRGQIMCEAMDFLRECAGDAMILGCGVPLGAAFGKVEYCRIGCDVTLDWDNTLVRQFLHRERDSTKNTILNTIYRRQLNGRAFLNDPDVFLLRRENTTLTAAQKTWLCKLNAICGSVLFTSDDVGRYDANQKAALQEMMKLRGYRVLSTRAYRNQVFVCCEKDGDVMTIILPLSGKMKK